MIKAAKAATRKHVAKKAELKADASRQKEILDVMDRMVDDVLMFSRERRSDVYTQIHLLRGDPAESSVPKIVRVLINTLVDDLRQQEGTRQQSMSVHQTICEPSDSNSLHLEDETGRESHVVP